MRHRGSASVRGGALVLAAAIAVLGCSSGTRLEGTGDAGPDDIPAVDDAEPDDGAPDGDDGTVSDDALDADGGDILPPDLCVDPPVGLVPFGNPCLDDTDCDPGLVCWPERTDLFDGLEYVAWAGGYCVSWGWDDAGCDPDDPNTCGPGAACAYMGIASPPDGRRAFGCFDACDPLTEDGRPHGHNCDCRPGYECSIALGVCVTGCSNGRECCEIWTDGVGGPLDGIPQPPEVVLLPPEVCANRCDTRTFRCVNEGCRSGECAIGDPCRHDTDCPADTWCRFLPTWPSAAPPGVCTLDACDAPGRECPDGTICADVRSLIPLGGFSCIASCTPRVPPADSGCPETLACHDLFGPSGTLVHGCLPPCDPGDPDACRPALACGPVSTGCLDGATFDADGDTISDLHESDVDTDLDGIPDWVAADSDADGIPDADEAGDADLATPPADCDGDTLPNCRDVDSDHDCLRDSDEVFLYHTDPCRPDTDGDGVDDWIELAFGSSPLDVTDGRLRWRDLVFVSPYHAAPSPADATVVFSTSLQAADVYFLIDTSASMDDERIALRDSIVTTVVPAVVAEIPDTMFGLGHFSDVPLAPYGAPGDEAFVDDLPMTADLTALRTTAEALVTRDGGDEPDSQTLALYTLATGRTDHGCPSAGPASCARGGHPCFRPETVHLVVLITDSPFHSGPGETDPYGTLDTGTCSAFRTTYEDARSALVAGDIRVLGIEAGGSAGARAQLAQLVADTGAVTPSGPIVRDVPGTGLGLGSAVVHAVQDVARDVPIDVRMVALDDPSDAVDAVDAFVAAVAPEPSGESIWDPATSSTRVCTVLPTADADGDTLPDSYPSLRPGTSVCFRLLPRTNDTVPTDWDAALFRTTLELRTERDLPLDSRDAFFLVPPYGECGGAYPGGK